MFKRIWFILKLFGSLQKVGFQILWGSWKISRLKRPRVTIFGGHLLPKDSKFSQQAHELSHKLMHEDISIITGGGPGIMQAASCGATPEEQLKLQARNVGITVKGLEKTGEPFNPCVQEKIVVDYFFARKWLLIKYSDAFAIFPGGFGTIDELGEIVTLVQTKKFPGIPIVLIGKEYWQPFITWLEDSALKNGLVTQADIKLIRVTDDMDEAFELLKYRCDVCGI